MNISSIGIRTKNIDEMIVILKQGLPADAFDKLRDRLKVSDNLLSRYCADIKTHFKSQTPRRTA